ncbi:MAG TPA: glutaredoxin domain-containing protein [Alphaproteobacteria bacterium]|nr:glutaredoxin domain-containing protein [Alphaproteobacteria bacterium]
MADAYKVYWQPGCTSCLRAKEFLKENGIAFESINVREDEGAMADLARLGAMSIPVITRGDEFAFAQEIRDLADFVGVELTRKRLPPAELNKKIDLILAAAQRFVRQIPADILRVNLPGRERNCLDLAYHIFVIPTAFLDAARGGSVTFEHFERLPPPELDTVERVNDYGQGVREDFAAWWGAGQVPETLDTYYGVQPAQGVMERTAWHAAQHCRQLMTVVAAAGFEPDGPLGEAELGGLPLPDEVYDDEVPLNTAAAASG